MKPHLLVHPEDDLHLPSASQDQYQIHVVSAEELNAFASFFGLSNWDFWPRGYSYIQENL